MQLEKKVFEEILSELKKLPYGVYDLNAELFWAQAPEGFNGHELLDTFCALKNGNVLYARINNRDLPVHGSDLAVSIRPGNSLNYVDVNEYLQELRPFLNTPLEIIGSAETPKVPGGYATEVWGIWMLRKENEDKGYLSNDVAQHFSRIRM